MLNLWYRYMFGYREVVNRLETRPPRCHAWISLVLVAVAMALPRSMSWVSWAVRVIGYILVVLGMDILIVSCVLFFMHVIKRAIVPRQGVDNLYLFWISMLPLCLGVPCWLLFSSFYATLCVSCLWLWVLLRRFYAIRVLYELSFCQAMMAYFSIGFVYVVIGVGVMMMAVA